MTQWASIARQTIARVHASLPENASFKARKKALKEAYPFGEREYWPYKAWCKARREYLRKFDPKYVPPSARKALADRVAAGEIMFPFAAEELQHG